MINPYKKNAKLVLSNGIVFPGFSFGSSGTTVGEIVFNTGMTGYQEVITPFIAPLDLRIFTKALVSIPHRPTIFFSTNH